ncbi:BTAD domain-containing putative transcriptional regulator [Kribbella sp. NPDC026611]|uniref:AfsR/SARP family transcriptional regulator n=1 Tax=Kribbella sp. NPDC026611 TaxID=3154911 RepID=UPI0033D081D0
MSEVVVCGVDPAVEMRRRDGREQGLLFQVLGPLRVTRAGQPVKVPPGQLSVILATLLLRPNQVVPASDLIGQLWNGRRSPRARQNLHVYTTRLRQVLGPDGPAVIRTEDGGYVASASAESLDLLRFTELLGRVDRAHAAGNLALEASLAAEAVDLWQRPILSNVASDGIQRDEVDHLEELWAIAVEHRIGAELSLGRHAELVPRLLGLVAEWPLRERYWAQLMTALYRSGRQSDALSAYRKLRIILTDELGVDPGPEVQQLHQRILNSDTTLFDAAGNPQIVRMRTVPAQLPAASPNFTGRAVEVEQLMESLAPSESAGPVMAVAAINGMPGVGKTTLAVYAAQKLASRFPDGQLFIDLHGFSKDVLPVQPADALERLLLALDVPVSEIPCRTEDRSALYRSKLADTRTLIVLDNARDERQVRPLLPGAAGCAVLVTSRTALSGPDNACTLSLGLLPPEDAVTLFAHIAELPVIGPPETLLELVEMCGRLPLAIRIAGTRLRSHPSWGVHELADQLRDPNRRLSVLDVGEWSIAGALALSYRNLTGPQQQLYRFLGLHPGVEVEAAAAAAMIGRSTEETSGLLEKLLDAHLLSEPAPDRFRFHPLVRIHAAALSARNDPSEARSAVLVRLIDHYTVSAGMRTATPVPNPPTPLDTELSDLAAATLDAANHLDRAQALAVAKAIRRSLSLQ